MKKKEKKVKKTAEKGYFSEILDELKKVKWPDKKDMFKYSVACIVFILIFGLYFYGLDIFFAWLMGLVS